MQVRDALDRLLTLRDDLVAGGSWVARDVSCVRAEIDRLRALPVLATCGECGHAPSRYARPRVCQHPTLFDRDDPALLTVEHADAPPAGCPLRGAR